MNLLDKKSTWNSFCLPVIYTASDRHFFQLVLFYFFSWKNQTWDEAKVIRQMNFEMGTIRVVEVDVGFLTKEINHYDMC